MKEPSLLVAGTVALVEVAEQWTNFIDAFTAPSTIAGVKAFFLLALIAVSVYAIRKGMKG